MIRLFLKKQSDLHLHLISMPFWQATTVQNLRTLFFSSVSLRLPKGEEGKKCLQSKDVYLKKMIDIIMFICPYSSVVI